MREGLKGISKEINESNWHAWTCHKGPRTGIFPSQMLRLQNEEIDWFDFKTPSKAKRITSIYTPSHNRTWDLSPALKATQLQKVEDNTDILPKWEMALITLPRSHSEPSFRTILSTHLMPQRICRPLKKFLSPFCRQRLMHQSYILHSQTSILRFTDIVSQLAKP